MAKGLRDMVADARGAVEQTSPESAREADLLVDVREPHEFSKSHLPGAVNIPRGMLELRADDSLPSADATLVGNREAHVVLYCTKSPSARSLLAAQTLQEMGYANVTALDGGLEAWVAAGLPTE